VSPETAFAKLTKWKDSSTRVRVNFNGVLPLSIRADVTGTIGVFDEESKILVISGTEASFEMHLPECTFDAVNFGSPNAADSAEIEEVLQICFPSGEKALLVAFRALN
jgi:hypothetical protein